MSKSIDLRSLLLGGLLVLVVLCILGAAPGAAPSMPAVSDARFAIAADTPDGEAYVLDTVTGQVWMRHGGSDEEFCEPKVSTMIPSESAGR